MPCALLHILKPDNISTNNELQNWLTELDALIAAMQSRFNDIAPHRPPVLEFSLSTELPMLSYLLGQLDQQNRPYRVAFMGEPPYWLEYPFLPPIGTLLINTGQSG